MEQDSIVIGGGCFWCLDALYRRVRGVTEVVSGYAGGDEPNPTYESTHGRNNTHAEVVRVTFDTAVIKTETILEIFWAMHDPTTRNQQGNDIGIEYRSIILYSDKNQKSIAKQSVENVAKKLWSKPITTEIKQLDTFWPAEDYHQDWFNKHPEQAYCQIIINPKIVKLKKKFSSLFVE